jgi:hypothetical protein
LSVVCCFDMGLEQRDKHNGIEKYLCRHERNTRGEFSQLKK